MESPRFLSVEQVIQLHRQGITLYGGELGIRDPGLLESAVLSPQQTFGGDYLHPSLFEMAAAYWFGLVMNHVFVDGNKRVGLFWPDTDRATMRWVSLTPAKKSEIAQALGGTFPGQLNDVDVFVV